jgi:nitrogen fixation NifU-like protein
LLGGDGVIDTLIYTETIKSHARHPISERETENATSRAVGHNPLCGDSVEVFIVARDRVIVDISFIGAGCQLMRASASLMCEHIKGGSLWLAELSYGDFTRAVKTGSPHTIGKLSALLPALKFPNRAECILLPWQALEDALDSERRKTA